MPLPIDQLAKLRADAATLVADIDALVADASPAPVPTPTPTPTPTPPPAPSALTIKRLSPANTGISYGGYGLQFCIGTVMPGAKVHQVWRGTFEFDAVTGTAVQKTVTMSDGSTAPTVPENFGQCWVPGENVVYHGTQAPGGVFNRFDPATGVYTPIPAVSTAGDSCLLYDAPRNRLLTCGGYVPFSMRTIALPAAAPPVAVLLGNPPSVTKDYAQQTLYRAGISSQGRIGVLADNNELWEWDGVAASWSSRPTTGTKPPLYSHCVYYEPADNYIAWCGSNVIAGGGIPGPVVASFYALSRATWAWQQLTVTGGTPSARVMAAAFLLADPERQQVLLFNSRGYVELWALDLRGLAGAPPAQPPSQTPLPAPTPTPGPTPSPAPVPAGSTTGKITSAALPAQSGGVYGQGFWGFPFVSNRQCKHTCMATDGRRIYAQGGDTLHSATDGTWSCALDGTDWRLEVGQPVYPTIPAPHALQDGFGFAWSPQRSKFLLWPGDYFAYDNGSNPPDPAKYTLLNDACGCWWFDPATKTYTQDRTLFGLYLGYDPATLKPTVPPTPTGTGCPFGGAYDEQADQFMVFGDGGDFATERWSVATMAKLPNVAFRVALAAGQTAYFRRTMPVKIGRTVYVIGYRSKGDVSSQTPLLLRWDLDALTMTELAPPPVDGTLIRDIEVRPGTSHGKLVWPFVNGPDGEIHGIHVYDPATHKWATDSQAPSYGTFIGNSVVSLPDGRVGWSGGAFDRQQTHFWFYEAN